LPSPAAGINSGALRLAMGVWIRDSSPDIVCFSGGREDGNINGTEASWGPWNCRCVPFITHIQFRFVLQLQRRRRQFWDSRNQDECILMATGLANLHNHCHGLWIYRKLCGHLSHEPMALNPTSTPTWKPLPLPRPLDRPFPIYWPIIEPLPNARHKMSAHIAGTSCVGNRIARSRNGK